MGRIVVLMAAAAMLLALAAGLAMAQAEPQGNFVDCSDSSKKKCKGTDNPEFIQGSTSRDIILAMAGGDGIDASNGGRDDVYGQGGNDEISVADGRGNDFVDCGDGDSDSVLFDTGDTVTRCEFTGGKGGARVAID